MRHYAVWPLSLYGRSFMVASKKQFMEQLVEELRSSGCYGSKPELREAPANLGTRYVAIGRLEDLAVTAATFWEDQETAPSDARALTVSSLAGGLAAAAAIVEQTFAQERQDPSPKCCAELQETFLAVKSFIKRLTDEGDHAEDHGSEVMSLLVATMVLRQLAERELNPGASQSFSVQSSAILPEFFNSCVRKLGWIPFNAVSGSRLVDLSRKVTAFTGEGPPATPAARA
jgi:hypothetical protein